MYGIFHKATGLKNLNVNLKKIKYLILVKRSFNDTSGSNFVKRYSSDEMIRKFFFYTVTLLNL